MKPQVLVIMLVSLFLLACSHQETKSEAADENLDAGPAELMNFVKKVNVDVVWRRSLGKGSGSRNIRLRPAVSGENVYMADYNGELWGLELSSGDELWSQNFDQPITSGVVVAENDLYIATQDGILHSIAKNSGEVQWSQPLSSESIAPLAFDKTQVYVRTIDGHLTAFERGSGKQNWTYEAALPVLTVHGTGSPVLMKSLVITGFANGKLVALDRELGIPRWSKRLAIPLGRSELERLVDLDGTPLVDEGIVYATAYHGKLSAIAYDGKTQWETELSSYFGPALGLGNLYVTRDDDHVQAYDQVNGASVWSQSALQGRFLNQPVKHNNYIVVADFEGYVHVLAQVDGEMIGRLSVRPKPLHMTLPNQPEMNNWRPLRGKDFGIRSVMQSTSQGLLAYTNAGELLLLQLANEHR
ncbi:MAG: outer membrane protein assembly factor BamB [Oleispira sp.]|nr:outer membrane protein assembly factor BamB [Oleispira sp.]